MAAFLSPRHPFQQKITKGVPNRAKPNVLSQTSKISLFLPCPKKFYRAHFCNSVKILQGKIVNGSAPLCWADFYNSVRTPTRKTSSPARIKTNLEKKNWGKMLPTRWADAERLKKSASLSQRKGKGEIRHIFSSL
jgi:hypothetical protein